MFVYPNINPIAFQWGPVKIFWYGIMYLMSFLIGWSLALYRSKRTAVTWTPEMISDLVFYVALGVVLGGRLGFMLFYDFSDFIWHPWIVFKTWEGGMSFHGGLIGVIIMMWLFARKTHKSFFDISDFVAPIVPIGLGAGRVGNFLNAELMGRVTTVPWGMLYPNAGSLPRHPSPLYEFFFEGILLFLILWWFSAKPRPRMAVSGLFSLGYGLFRCLCECFRQPDMQAGFIAFGWMTKGQLLSLPMILIGIILLTAAYHKK